MVINGAKKAYAVDYNKKAIDTINKNINKINIENIYVLNMDYKKALKYLYDNNIQFNIIFLDPPYKTNYIEESIKMIDEYNLLKDKGIIVCENDNLDKIIYTNKFKEIKSKKYGEKHVVLLKKI